MDCKLLNHSPLPLAGLLLDFGMTPTAERGGLTLAGGGGGSNAPRASILPSLDTGTGTSTPTHSGLGEGFLAGAS